MAPQRLKKKKPEEISREGVRELSLSPENWQEFEHGVTLFNSGKFWHAHEAWELVWQQHAEDERLFFQGLIQLAAAYHLLVTKRSLRSMANNLDKAREKLEVFQPEFCGIAVSPLLENIEEAKSEIDRLGSNGASEFDYDIIPKLRFHKPGNPDLMVEIKDIVQDGAFLEGAKLFNEGYFWEAHEAWEEVWRGREGDAKSFMQGFVEAAAGCNFLKQAKRANAIYLLGKSIEKFRQFENLHVGFALRPFVDGLGVLVNALQSGADPRSANGKSVSIPRIPLPHSAVS
jgi:predicted metal-dependent hydrolase